MGRDVRNDLPLRFGPVRRYRSASGEDLPLLAPPLAQQRADAKACCHQQRTIAAAAAPSTRFWFSKLVRLPTRAQ
jgi:hypothetical protein